MSRTVTAQDLRIERIARESLRALGIFDEEAIERLALALTEWGGVLASYVRRLPPLEGDGDLPATFSGEEPDDAHAVHLFDAALIWAIGALDPQEARSARAARNKARLDPRRRWELWIDDSWPPERLELVGLANAPTKPVCDAYLAFAETLWRTKVAPTWDTLRERARASRPATIYAVNRELLAPLMAGRIAAHEDQATLGGHVLGLIHRDAPKHIAVGLARAGAVLGHRLVKFLVQAAWEAKERGETDYRRVVVSGGWKALQAKLGASSSASELLQLLVAVGSRIAWESSKIVKGNLWGFAEYRGSVGKPGSLAFVLSDLLLPGRAHELATGPNAQMAAQREARLLVPELRTEPPMGVLRERDHGAAWTLARFFVLELVDKSKDLATHGGARITSVRWGEMADEAGFPRKALPKLLDTWRSGDIVTPALVVEVSPERFHLGPAHDLEREFLDAQGKVRAEGATQGRAGAAKRWRNG